VSARQRMVARFVTAASGTPPTDEQKSAINMLQSAAVDLATAIEMLVPDGRDKSIALTHLEDTLMRAVRGIFTGGHDAPHPAPRSN